MKGYADLGDLPEDDRIQKIGECAMAGSTVGFIVEHDDDQGNKADRYITKLRAKFPGITIIGSFSGPIAGCTTVKVGPPRQ